MKNNLLTGCLVLLCWSASAQVRTRDLYHAFLRERTAPSEISAAEKILILHFDFCSVNSYCKDTASLMRFIASLKPTDIVVVDTLYNSYIPSYITFPKIVFVNRTELQRKGLYSEKPVLIRKNRKKVKLL